MKRSVFYISDRTGITAEVLGQSLLSQFENIEFKQVALPFTDSPEKAAAAVERINQAAEDDGFLPIVFDTIIQNDIRDIIKKSRSLVMDFFHTFIGPLEAEFGVKSSFTVGKTHSTHNPQIYEQRIQAVNFALNNDDGAVTKYYDDADIILVGVSRCGKTPTSLYLSMQFGVKAANYPFIADDMDHLKLPKILQIHKSKLFGLTINPDRLHEIRTERRANSQYASLRQCQIELREVEQLFKRERISYINTTSRSIEEISTKILSQTGIERRSF